MRLVGELRHPHQRSRVADLEAADRSIEALEGRFVVFIRRDLDERAHDLLRPRNTPAVSLNGSAGSKGTRTALAALALRNGFRDFSLHTSCIFGLLRYNDCRTEFSTIISSDLNKTIK